MQIIAHVPRYLLLFLTFHFQGRISRGWEVGKSHRNIGIEQTIENKD